MKNRKKRVALDTGFKRKDYRGYIAKLGVKDKMLTKSSKLSLEQKLAIIRKDLKF